MEAASNPPPVASVRDWRERALQTLAYEAGGLLAVSPLWSIAAGVTAIESATLLICLSIAVMSWMAIYNTAFDILDARFAGRVASDRPHRWRVLHAAGLEVTSVLATWPLIAWLADLGWLEALAADLGLTLAYVVYGYLFHLGFDRWRPVAGSARPLAGSQREPGDVRASQAE